MDHNFYLRDANLVAVDLLGKKITHYSPIGKTSGIIVEVESYIGPTDKASHAYDNKRTPRTEIQFSNGGVAYVYSIYGLHVCFNVVTNIQNKPEVVLIRALQPLEGIELMKLRRGCGEEINLCNGPGKLCEAMGITKDNYGDDLVNSSLIIEPYIELDKTQILVSPRINIDYAEECKNYMWRYFLKDNPYVSKTNIKYKSASRIFSGF